LRTATTADLRERDKRLSDQDAQLVNIKRILKLAAIVIVLAIAFVGGALALGLEQAWILVLVVGAIAGLVAAVDQLMSKARK